MLKKANLILILLCIIQFQLSSQTCTPNYLSAQGSKLYDSKGKEVRLTGVNWFGFETSMLYPHGIWSRDCKSMLQHIKDQGFNCIRIPWCNKILDPAATIKINSYGTDPYTGISPMNALEATKTKPVEILDIIVQWCQENNMKIILDNHSRKPDGYMEELLWYTSSVSEAKWIEDWVTLAVRYKDYDAVVGMDLNNEPHGKSTGGATWGNSNSATDWNKAAERCGNAILKVNPNVLILVEGIEMYNGIGYWWGGNLLGVKDYPIQLSKSNKLVYSPHEYGPTVWAQEWFSAANFPSNMPAIWEKYFNFIITQNIAPLLIGEFGIRDAGGKDEVWFDALLKFMGTKYSWTFWCWNPNSGDTGGLIDDQWKTIVSWKMKKLKPYLAAEIPNCGGSIPQNQSPDAILTANPTSGQVPLNVNFNASGSSDPDGSIIMYSWNFGDGTSGTGSTILHNYSSAGSYIATLTVTDNDGATDQASITITSGSFIIPVTGVSVTPTSAVLNSIGETAILSANVTPKNATIKNVIWSSSNSAVALVSSSGVVTALAEGMVTITATTVHGGYKATSSVTVSPSTDIPVTGVNVTPTSVTINSIGGTTKLIATVEPTNATNKSLTWSSSNTSAATVNSSGIVTAVADGNSTITVTTANGFSATSIITVKVGTNPSPCDNPVSITIPFAKDGKGEFCYVTSQSIAYINSWNMGLVEINGVDFTNKWSNSLPAAIDGKWYIVYEGLYAWSHFEAPALKSVDVELIGEPITFLNVYPNPANDFVSIESNMLINQVQIISLDGKVIYSTEYNVYATSIEISKIPQGIYILKVQTEKSIVTERLTIN